MANVNDFAMSYESMEDAASKITLAEEDLGTLITNLTSVVSTLGEGYTGESYNAFLNAWNESRPTIEKLKEAVGNFAPALRTAAENQRQSDQSTARKMDGLKF